jgi:hypothetical protein
MKMLVSNLTELMPENQELLAQLLYLTMASNGFIVDGLKTQFIAEVAK